MLTRTRTRARDNTLHAIASKRYRQRQRDGDFVVPVPLNAMVIDWLIDKAGFISEADAESGDRVRLGQLIGDGLKPSAARARKPDHHQD